MSASADDLTTTLAPITSRATLSSSRIPRQDHAMIFQFLAAHQNQILLGLGIFIVSLVVSSLIGGFIIVRMPANHFDPDRRITDHSHRPQWQRVLRVIAKNTLGVALLILGFIMSLPGVPGQGLLTMFIGLVLLDFPGKRDLERRIISRPTILDACNRLRDRFGKEPFTLAPPPHDEMHSGQTNSSEVANDDHGRTK